MPSFSVRYKIRGMYKILLTEMGNVHKINPNYLTTTHNSRDTEYQPIDMDETWTWASKFITCHIKQWPDYWLAELPNTVLNCSMHGMVTARLISETPRKHCIFFKNSCSAGSTSRASVTVDNFEMDSKCLAVCVYSASNLINLPLHICANNQHVIMSLLYILLYVFHYLTPLYLHLLWCHCICHVSCMLLITHIHTYIHGQFSNQLFTNFTFIILLTQWVNGPNIKLICTLYV
jgi:hypothetical protein